MKLREFVKDNCLNDREVCIVPRSSKHWVPIENSFMYDKCLFSGCPINIPCRFDDLIVIHDFTSFMFYQHCIVVDC